MPPAHASKTRKNGNGDKDPARRGMGRAGAVDGEASAALRRRAGPGVSAACAGSTAGDGAARIPAAGACFENRESGNHDKDPIERGTGRAGAVHSEAAAGAQGAVGGGAGGARVQRAALAPWRAAIARARLVKRAVLAARRAARIAKHDKDPMERRPGGCLAGGAAGTAAATDVLGAGTTPNVMSPAQDGPGHGDGRALKVGGGPGIGEILQRPYGGRPATVKQ